MRGCEVGRIRGIPIEAPPLFVLWTAFLWWSLSTGFPRSHVGFPDLTYRYLAAGATLLVLASILVHELVALSIQKALGAPLPARIVIGPWGAGWLAGSVQSTEPAVIRAEIVAAFCGPAVYMGMAVGYIGLGLVLQPHVPDFLPTRAVTDTLAIANATLAFLNLLPGAPVDAGRVISAIVRRATGSVDRAQRAVRAGGLMIGLWCCALGVLALVTMGSVWSFWGVVIGTAFLEGLAVVAPPPGEEAGRTAPESAS